MADISRDIYSEAKRYVIGIVQRGIAWVDADENDARMGLYQSVRRAFQFGMGDGFPKDLPNSFKVVQAGSPTNDFVIAGGGGAPESAARFWNGGHQCLLYSDVQYNNLGATDGQRSIFPRSTLLTALVLTDTRMNWVPNELAGRQIIPDVTDGTAFTIASNTATTITISSGDMTTVATTGAPYRISLTTPVGARSDGVYLNTWLREVDGVEDPNILHDFGTGPEEHQTRYQVQQVIFVRENTTGFGEPGDYDDLAGAKHYVYKLASIARLAGNSNILTAMITDLRGQLGQGLSEMLKVSSDDTTANYLQAKVEAAAGSPLSVVTAHPGGNEHLALDIDNLDISRIAPETAGGAMVFDASGEPACTAAGTAGQPLLSGGAAAAAFGDLSAAQMAHEGVSGQFLRSNGAGGPPTWQTYAPSAPIKNYDSQVFNGTGGPAIFFTFYWTPETTKLFITGSAWWGTSGRCNATGVIDVASGLFIVGEEGSAHHDGTYWRNRYTLANGGAGSGNWMPTSYDQSCGVYTYAWVPASLYIQLAWVGSSINQGQVTIIAF